MNARYPKRLPKTAFILLLAFACFASNDATEPGSLPNARLTPGDTLPVTVQDICTAGYTKLVRQVPSAVKHRVYAGMAANRVRACAARSII
jgi:hypothetical protein